MIFIILICGTLLALYIIVNSNAVRYVDAIYNPEINKMYTKEELNQTIDMLVAQYLVIKKLSGIDKCAKYEAKLNSWIAIVQAKIDMIETYESEAS